MRTDDATTLLHAEAAAQLRLAPGVRRAVFRPSGVAATVAGSDVLVTVDEGAESGRGIRGEGNPASRPGAGAPMSRNRGVLTVARTGGDGIAERPGRGATFALVDADGLETSVVWSVAGPVAENDGLWLVQVALSAGAGSAVGPGVTL